MYSEFSTITSRLQLRFSLLLLLLILAPGRALAQYNSLPFTILDAEDRTLTDGLGHVWDPEDGIWTPSSLSLPERTGLEVFVTNEVCADSIVYWSKSNKKAYRNLVTEFVNEYRQRGWMLHKHDGSYNLLDINAIARDIYDQYPSVIDYWNEQTRDPRGVYAMALVLHPQEGGPFESIILSEKVTKYDGDEALCPIYYKNRTVLSNVETFRKRTHFRRNHGSSASLGSWITFKEHFNIAGDPDERLVVDRIISTCNFESDIQVVQAALPADDNGIKDYAASVLGYNYQGEKHSYRLRPFVFAGEGFQQQLERRTRGNVLRDTLEHYRINTSTQMKSLRNQVEYREVEPDTMTYVVPQPLWKLLLRYRTFDKIREQVRKSSPWLPEVVTDADTVRSYVANTPTDVYRQFQAYVDSGHVMADRHAVSSEANLYEGYISRQNQMDLYPQLGTNRRVRIEHIAEEIEKAPEPIMLSKEPVDTMFSYRWQMPDPNRFYQLRHVDYLHDFIHADTVTSEECGCEREMPLQFLNLSSHTATFNCPPRKSSTTDELVSFKPRARGELSDAVYHLSLTFARSSSKLDMSLGSNKAQMDSLVQKAYEITHNLDSRIQQVSILGISSPEGRRTLNVALSHDRSNTIIESLRKMGGAELARARFRIVNDSVAPWAAVPDIIESEMPEDRATAQRIREAIEGLSPLDFNTAADRIGYDHWHHDPVIDKALERLREVQVTYSYKAVMEATEQMIIERFRRASSYDNFPPDYYYWILMSKYTTHDEKAAVAKALLRSHATDVRRYLTDMHPSNSYGLVLPMAANFLAQDSLRLGHYNREILAPFISRELFQGNIPCYMVNDPETPVKFINLDVLLYNQILMLCNIGSPEALAEAYDLADILNETPTLSPQFRQTYKPEHLEMLIGSHSGNFLDDPGQAEVMRQSNVNNMFVVNLAEIYTKSEGRIEALGSIEDCASRLQQCSDSLSILQEREPDDPATWYFTAVVRMWQAESIGGYDKDSFVNDAVDALCRLFMIESEPSYITRLQGDSYVRHFYRNPANRQARQDIYLEAVERYISSTYNK